MLWVSLNTLRKEDIDKASAFSEDVGKQGLPTGLTAIFRFMLL